MLGDKPKWCVRGGKGGTIGRRQLKAKGREGGLIEVCQGCMALAHAPRNVLAQGLQNL